MNSESLPTPYSDGYDEINRLISMVQCDEPLVGLPPQLFQFWKQEDHQLVLQSSPANGFHEESSSLAILGYPHLRVVTPYENGTYPQQSSSPLQESETVPSAMSLSLLAERCSHEMSKFRRKEPSDDQYCLEILRRALVQHDEDAWNVVYAQLQETVRHWFRSDASRTAALRHADEQSYIDDTFRRFWQSVKVQHLEFPSLSSALRYLRLCLNSVIIDTLRAYARKQVQALPEPSSPDELLVEDNYHESEWWSVIESILTNERERRIIYLLYHCGLKPREIVMLCPDEFTNEQEVYRLWRNGSDRLKRHQDKLLHKLDWKLSDDSEDSFRSGTYTEVYVPRLRGTFIMDKCPFCLSETRPGDNFCLNCGNRLVPTTPSPTPSQMQPEVGDATLAASDDWESGSLGSNADATLQPDAIEHPARLILRSASGEVLDEYPLKKLEMSIGRVTTSDIALLRDKLTSRRHATVRYENGRYVLRDERSANGTFVNGRQLTELTPHLLQNGDRIGIGEHELVFWEYSSQAAAVEDLPTLPGPLNFSEATYSTRSDASATLPATSDEFDTQVMDNGASDGTFAAPQPTAAKAEYGAAQPTHDSAQPAAAPAQPQVPIPATISYNVSASPPAPPATSAPPTTPTAGTNTAGAPTPVKPDVPRTDANVTLSRLTSIALPPLPDLTTLMAAVSTLDHQVATLQEQFHTTQEAMRSHDAEIAQVISQLRTGVQRVADRMDSTIAGVARKREKVAWPELSQLIQDVIDNPRDIEYVVKLAQKARALKEIIETYQNVVQTMAECNSLLRSMIGQDR